MDATGLPALFSQSNPFLAQMGVQSFNQDQAKAQQALLAAQGQEQRAQAMQPLEEAHKQALTRQGNANAASVEDNMAAQVPAAERLKQKMLEFHSKGTELERSQREADMYERGQNAAIIKANGGQIPVWLLSKIPQNELQMYQGKGLDTTMNILKAYHETHPKTMEARATQANDLERARIMAGPGYARAAAGGTKTGKPPGSPSALMTHYTMKANEEEEGSPEWSKYMALANNEWQKLQALKAQAAEAAQTGKIDLPATVQGGTPVVRGSPTPSSMPGTKPPQWTPPAGWK